MADEERDDLMDAAAGEFSLDEEISESEGGGGKKKLIFVVLGLLLVGGGGAGVYFSGLLGNEPEESAEAAATPPPPAEETKFVDLPDMLVNIDSAGARPSYLKIRVSLELDMDVDTAAIRAMSPRIEDKFQTYLRELRLEDMKGGAGFALLRKELRVRINAAIDPIKVKDVLFRNLLIQ